MPIPCNRCDYVATEEETAETCYCPKCGSCGECGCCPCNKPECDWCKDEPERQAAFAAEDAGE